MQNHHHDLYPILDAFFDLITPLKAHFQIPALQISSDSDFRDFLQSTVIASNKPLSSVSANKPSKSIAQVIQKAQTCIFSRFYEQNPSRPVAVHGHSTPWRPSNVLTEGYHAQRDGPPIERTRNSTIQSILENSHWQKLAALVDSARLTRLFADCDILIFTQIPNKSFIQLSGTPLSELKQIKKLEVYKHPICSRNTGTKKRERGLRSERHRKRSKKKQVTEPARESPNEKPQKRLITQEANGSDNQMPLKKRKLRHFVSEPTIPVSTISQAEFYLRPPGLQHSLSLPELPALSTTRQHEPKISDSSVYKRASEVFIPRSRMFYSRRSPKTRSFQLSPKHILSRIQSMYPSSNSPQNTISHLKKYVFPRSYGLFSAFVEIQPAKGYPYDLVYQDRSHEIQELAKRSGGRILGKIEMLNRSGVNDCISEMLWGVKKAQKRWKTILNLTCPSRHNCPVLPDSCLQEYQIPHYQVSSFVKRLVNLIVMKDVWGSERNIKKIYKNIDAFISFRRFETISIHTVMQGFHTTDCEWLFSKSKAKTRVSLTETQAAKRLLEDFLYWFWDSLIVEIIRSTFYVTESSSSKNRLLYYRLDDWHALTQPTWDKLRSVMFEKLTRASANAILHNRDLGHASIRYIPKETGLRLISNLARKPVIIQSKDIKLGRSINSFLAPILPILNLAKSKNSFLPLLGASINGPSDIHSKLTTFKSHLLSQHKSLPTLYFVKADIRACYDSIDQNKLISILERLMQGDEEYTTHRYDEVSQRFGAIVRSWPRVASHLHSEKDFASFIQSTNQPKTVYAEKAYLLDYPPATVLELLKSHIKDHLISVDNIYYRQKIGIPQGSTLSSFLCNLFYGEMERKELGFLLEGKDNMFVRYIDDFLLVTTSKSNAFEFLRIMCHGIDEFKCKIFPDKVLVNFIASLDGIVMLPRLPSNTKSIPFCGLTINVDTLEVMTDLERYDNTRAVDKLTVERNKSAGDSFLRKMLKECQRRFHILYMDSKKLNTPMTVYKNIYHSFLFIAVKFRDYLFEWGGNRNDGYLIKVIKCIIEYAWATLRQSTLRMTNIHWLAYHAFQLVLKRNPAKYKNIMHQLKVMMDEKSVKWGDLQVKEILRVENQFWEGLAWERVRLSKMDKSR